MGPTWDQTTPVGQQTAQGNIPTWEGTTDIQETHGTPLEQLKAGAEGAAQAIGSFAAPALEEKLGVDPQDIRLREAANPWTKGLAEAAMFGGTLLATGGMSAEARIALEAGTIAKEAAQGTGLLAKITQYGTVPGLVTKAGEMAAQATGLGAEGAGVLSKAGAAATQGFTEMAFLGAGNELSQTIQDNPPESVGMALGNIGLSGLIGAVGGGALGAINPLWKASVGDKAGQLLEDMRGRIKFRMDNPDLVNAAGEELQGYYKNLKDMNDSVWGPTGVKAEAIEKLMPEMNGKIKIATEDLASSLNSKVLEMQANPDIFPKRLVTQFESQTNRIIDAVTDPLSTPSKIFDAVQTTKQWAQDATKSMWKYASFDPEYEFAQKVLGLSKSLRPFLENPEIWGKAGEAQQLINKAFTKYLPSLQDFEKKFTSKIGNDRIVDVGKMQTLKNQLGKANGELKQSMLQNFLDDSGKYQKAISQAHEQIESENPFQHTSLSAIKGFLGKQTPGAIIADKLMDKGLAKIAGQTIGGTVGSAIGSAVGHPAIGFLAGEHAIGPTIESILPALAKPIMENPSSASGLKAAADYGLAVVKGEKLFNSAAKNLFKGNAEILPKYLFPDEKQRKRLEKRLDEAQTDPSKLLNIGGDIGHYLPHHNITIAETAARAINYLNSIKPKSPTRGLLDGKFEISNAAKAAYERNLDIAEQPLIVVQHIKDGTLQSGDVVALKNMFPGAYSKLKSTLTHQLIEHTSREEMIPYEQRLGLSLFLAQPLDSTMSPQAIMAAQTSGQSQPEQPQMMPQHKHGSMKNVNKLAQGNASGNQLREMQKAGTAKV